MREGREGGQAAKPAILVVSALQGPVEKQVLAGMEEEGVPFVLERASADQQADELASGAALRSTLEVGVGIDGMGHDLAPGVVDRLLPPLLQFLGARTRTT